MTRPGTSPTGARLQRRAASLVGVLLAAASLVWSASPASAHAYLVTSNPPDGSVVKLGPQTVWLEFNDQLDSSLVKIAIIDSAGHAQAPTQVVVEPQRPTRLDVSIPALPRGVYRLTFRVRDSVDLHLTDGTVTFGVGIAPTGPPARPSSPAPDWIEVLMRWLGSAGLACMLGAITMTFVVVPRALRHDARRKRLRRVMLTLAIGGALVALAGDTILLAYEASTIGPVFSTFSRLLTASSLGTRWRAESTITTALVILLAWFRFREAHPSPSGPGRWMRGPWIALGGGALAIADTVAVGFGSHTGGSASPTAGGVTLRAAHLISVGAWIGGVMALVVLLAVLRRDPDPNARRAQRALLSTFSGVAAAGLAAVLVTGLLLSGAEVSTITAMFSTWYGAFLVAKLVLVAAVIIIGWLNRRAVTGRLARLPMRTVTIEAAVGVVVIGLGATLAATLPARGPQFLPPPAVQPSTLTANAADLLVQVSIQPNRPGTNLLTAVVSNTRRPVPAPITGVSLRLSSAIASPQLVQTTQAADGSWSGGQLNLVPGAMTVVATVHRPGLPDASVSVPFDVNPAPAWHQQTVVSPARWTPIAEGLALLIGLIAGVGLWRARRRHRRQRRYRPAHVAPLAPSPPLPVVVAAIPEESPAQR